MAYRQRQTDRQARRQTRKETETTHTYIYVHTYICIHLDRDPQTYIQSRAAYIHTYRDIQTYGQPDIHTDVKRRKNTRIHENRDTDKHINT